MRVLWPKIYDNFMSNLFSLFFSITHTTCIIIRIIWTRNHAESASNEQFQAIEIIITIIANLFAGMYLLFSVTTYNIGLYSYYLLLVRKRPIVSLFIGIAGVAVPSPNIYYSFRKLKYCCDRRQNADIELLFMIEFPFSAMTAILVLIVK